MVEEAVEVVEAGTPGPPGSVITPFATPSLSLIPPSVKVSVIVSPTTEIGTRMTNVPDLTLTQTVSDGSAPGIVIVTIVVPPTGQPTILKLKKPKGKLYEGGNGLTLPVGTADRLPHHPQLVVNVAVPPTEVITVAVEGKMTVVV